MLKKIRVSLAFVFFTGLTLLFLDFTGTVSAWLGWMAKAQFLPAILGLNLTAVLIVLALTLLFGRVYCSIICPLGVFQDGVSWLRSRIRKKARFRFRAKRECKPVRYGMLALVIAAFIAGFGSLVALADPYGAFGRIASNFFAPLWQWGNNLLAMAAEHFGSYAFYSREVWFKGLPTFLLAAAWLVLVVVMPWVGGRDYCNSICPVGTVLGMFSRFSLFKVRIDGSACNGCGLCEKQCKSSCIDSKGHKIDYSRCVACMNCIGTCSKGAISFSAQCASGNASKDVCKDASKGAEAPSEDAGCEASKPEGKADDPGRRAFVTSAVLLAGAASASAQEMKLDGGLAEIKKKRSPERKTPVKPAGSHSVRQFGKRCTGCQLCVMECPNNVLRPSSDLKTLMQPEMSFERGYCRTECTKCSEICPAGAIERVSVEEKSSIKVGTAVVDLSLCLAHEEGISCNACASKCPAAAIKRVPKNPDGEKGVMIPVVLEEKCIGCGKCEYVCPARPVSAIHIEGVSVHSEI
ncbi:MAG: 4Fe-4S binding protein [Bacteroidales bacterium]|nr:4Fe-4S binding protein [Bacteroidales bacterium]